jgi:hypothetical protein
LRWPLNTNSGKTNSWYDPVYAAQKWPDVEKRHATMIRRVDDAVDDIFQLLRDLHMDTNTLVIFTSDNGPHNEDGQNPAFFDSWGVMDGIKRDLWEAGVREPTLAWWPGHIQAGSTNDTISGFWDWMPTFADIGGLAPPAQSDGVSILPSLIGKGTERSRGFWYFEYDYSGRPFPVDKELGKRKHFKRRNQMQAIRIGDFTAVRYSVTNSADAFRLYNVVTDPHEDPAYDGRVEEARAMTKEVRRPEPSAPRPYDDDLVPAVSVNCKTNGVLADAVYEGTWPWVPDFDALTPVSTGTCAGLNPGVLTGTGEGGIAFKGYINVPADGDYTFYLQSDSGAEMWLHEAHVIDDDFNHDGSEVSASIRLAAGLHPIRIFYRHKAGEAKLRLNYSGPGIEKQPVPTEAFSGPCGK